MDGVQLKLGMRRQTWRSSANKLSLAPDVFGPYYEVVSGSV